MKITKEQFHHKYGKVNLKFHSFHKSSYGFTGETPDGNTIMYQIREDEEFSSGFVYDKEGNTIEYFQEDL